MTCLEVLVPTLVLKTSAECVTFKINTLNKFMMSMVSCGFWTAEEYNKICANVDEMDDKIDSTDAVDVNKDNLFNDYETL